MSHARKSRRLPVFSMLRLFKPHLNASIRRRPEQDDGTWSVLRLRLGEDAVIAAIATAWRWHLSLAAYVCVFLSGSKMPTAQTGSGKSEGVGLYFVWRIASWLKIDNWKLRQSKFVL